MKRKHLAIVLLFVYSVCFRGKLLFQGSSPIHYLNNLDAWELSGRQRSAPPNFFLPNQVFHVQAGHALTALGDFWSVSGADLIGGGRRSRIVSGPYVIRSPSGSKMAAPMR